MHRHGGRHRHLPRRNPRPQGERLRVHLPRRPQRRLRHPGGAAFRPERVTIGGTCLLDAAAVVLGNGLTQAPATFVNLSPTQILAVVPAVLPGTYSVLVTTPGGTDTTAPPTLLVL
ncbi:IPT/TIG domain-containing protein [Streptomyces antimycoticus]|uniref:IPT/TIG domain-containing protein n=1 Tax=Streptomyces antimycoticus TaxID=68175 RepID=UPI003530DC3A